MNDRVLARSGWSSRSGSSLVTNQGEGLDLAAIGRWVAQIARTGATGKEAVLVSSGAIAEGMQRLGWKKRPHAMHELQAAAAVGQMGLAQGYEALLPRALGLTPRRCCSPMPTWRTGALPQRALDAAHAARARRGPGHQRERHRRDRRDPLGDNDTLAALVTNLIEADALVILTDQAGLFAADPRKDPRATLVRDARAGDPALEDMAGGAGSALGRGGMLTKVLAAKRAARSGAHTVIASRPRTRRAGAAGAGERIGTLLRRYRAARGAQAVARRPPPGGRPAAAGCRRGAARSPRGGKSLLPIGVKRSGQASSSAARSVGCAAPDGREMARGLVNYNAAEARRILGRPSSEIESDPRLRGRAGADPPRQPGTALSRDHMPPVIEPSGRASRWPPRRSASTPSRAELMTGSRGRNNSGTARAGTRRSHAARSGPSRSPSPLARRRHGSHAHRLRSRVLQRKAS